MQWPAGPLGLAVRATPKFGRAIFDRQERQMPTVDQKACPDPQDPGDHGVHNLAKGQPDERRDADERKRGIGEKMEDDMAAHQASLARRGRADKRL